jgi:hypothetical protein
MQYRPRQMPKRFTDGMPVAVKRDVLDIIKITPAAPLDYDVIFRDVSPNGGQVTGLDFGTCGEQGCHFFLNWYEMRGYRERNRRKRVAWKDLPAETQRAIVRYCEEPA